MKPLYLLIDIGSLLFPLIFSFHPKLNFYKKFRPCLSAIITMLIPFVIWDIYFTELGVWGFNSKYLLGYQVWNLPFEELLFFICIPFACLFTYNCFKILYTKPVFKKIEPYVSITLIILLGFFGFGNASKLYTFYTFISLLAFLLFLKFWIKVHWLNRFYFTYLLLIFPFFIVNGILTGTGLEEPVVWYNGHENLGLRLLSIPIEDLFYGMLLILGNVFFFELYDALHNKKQVD